MQKQRDGAVKLVNLLLEDYDDRSADHILKAVIARLIAQGGSAPSFEVITALLDEAAYLLAHDPEFSPDDIRDAVGPYMKRAVELVREARPQP